MACARIHLGEVIKAPETWRSQETYACRRNALRRVRRADFVTPLPSARLGRNAAEDSCRGSEEIFDAVSLLAREFRGNINGKRPSSTTLRVCIGDLRGTAADTRTHGAKEKTTWASPPASFS